MRLKDPSLLKSHGYINGVWQGNDGELLDVCNPSSGAMLAQVATHDESMVHAAIEAAAAAEQAWSQTSNDHRSELLMAWHDLILENKDDLAYLLTSEQGKPLSEALGEIAYGASYIKWFAQEARRIVQYSVQTGDQQELKVYQKPVGIVAAITPWNFPNAMLARKLAPALAAGCTAVCKPASATPLSALALVALAERAGIPKGVLNIVVGNAAMIGKLLANHPLVKKISFTGSTEVGKQLMSEASSTLKRLSLELGGNAPFIVFDDADLKAAVDGAMMAKFRNGGQTCVCANRIFVQEAIFDQFIELFAEKIRRLVVGDGCGEGVQIGPLIHSEAVKSVARLVDDALSKGASCLEGGRASEDGRYYHPTLLVDVDDSMTLYHQEIFGPVAAVYRFQDQEQVTKMANSTPYGLASYVYSQNMNTCREMEKALDFGIIGINTGLISNAKAPFGGVKESGFGREGGLVGIEDYLSIQYSCHQF